MKIRWAVAVCVIVAAVSRLSFIFDPFKNDAGIYVYFGRVLWSGGQLYRDFWDTKLPSVALLTAPLYGAFGNHWLAYVVLQGVMGISAAFILAGAVGRYVGRSAYAPALLFGLIAFNFQRIVMTGFQLETFQLFFEVVAASVVLRSLRRPGMGQVFVAGLLVALAMMPKPGGFAVGLAATCAYLWEARNGGMASGAKRIALLWLGAAIPILLVAAWVESQPWRVEMPELLRQIRLYGSGTPIRRFLDFRPWVFFLLPLSPLVIRWVLDRTGVGAKRQGEQATESGSNGAFFVFAVCWCVFEFLGVAMQRRLYSYHFLVIMPAVVLLFAISRPTRLAIVLASIAPLAVLSLCYSAAGFAMYRNGGQMPISRYIEAHTKPGDAVWADPAGRLLLETNREAGSRLQMTFYLVNYDGAPRHFADILLGDFEQRKPKYIMLMQDWAHTMYSVPAVSGWMKWVPERERAYEAQCHRIENYVRSHYHLEKTLDGREAWRRNE